MMLAMENAGNLIEDEELRQQIKKTGIGTSATRGQIIKKLVDIGYLNENKKTLILTPSKLGEMIFEVVDMSVPSLLNPEMTANWEKGLEGIINGSVDAGEYRDRLEEYIRTETERMIKSDSMNDLVGRINPFTDKNSKGAATRKPLGLKCPKCGGELTTTSFGYGCSNYWNKEEPCRFSVGRIAGLELSQEDLTDLIEKGKTRVIDGFTSSKKNKFSASLKLSRESDGEVKIVFDFPDNNRYEPGEVKGLKCPMCGGRVMRTGRGGYECEDHKDGDSASCRFNIDTIYRHKITESELRSLVDNGITDVIKNMTAPNNVRFDARLKLKRDENGKVTGMGVERV